MEITPIDESRLARTGEEYLELLASNADWIVRTADDVKQLREAKDGAYAKLLEEDFQEFLSSLKFNRGGVVTGYYRPLLTSLTLADMFEVFARFGIGKEYVLRIHENECVGATWKFSFWHFCASNCGAAER